jgi:hypothetical protein
MLAGYPGTNLAWATEAGAAVATGGLTLTTDPPGAAVYVDGKAHGTTPVAVPALAAGEHRVKVVKDGYLENSRVVTLAPGRTENLQVKLTQGGRRSSAAMQVDEDKDKNKGGGGGNGKKIALIAVGVAAVGAGAFLLLGGNDPPVAGTVAATPSGTGMAGITSYSFTAQGASDPDNDPLTYNWNFGDGASGSGAQTSHTYTNAGTFNVTLAVSDGKHTVNAAGATVTVARSMVGAWGNPAVPGFANTNVTFTFTQSGTTLGGTMTFVGDVFGTVSGVTGTVGATTYATSASFRGSFTVSGFPGTFTTSFTGNTDAAGNSMTGTITTANPSLSPPSFSAPATFTRR